MPGGKQRPPSPQVLVDGCAKQLETLNEVALQQIESGSPNGVVVEYRQLPEVIHGAVAFLMFSTIKGAVLADHSRVSWGRLECVCECNKASTRCCGRIFLHM